MSRTMQEQFISNSAKAHTTEEAEQVFVWLTRNAVMIRSRTHDGNTGGYGKKETVVTFPDGTSVTMLDGADEGSLELHRGKQHDHRRNNWALISGKNDGGAELVRLLDKLRREPDAETPDAATALRDG